MMDSSTNFIAALVKFSLIVQTTFLFKYYLGIRIAESLLIITIEQEIKINDINSEMVKRRKKTSFQADFEHASKRKKRKKIHDLSQHNIIESMIGYATVSFDNIHQAQEEL